MTNLQRWVLPLLLMFGSGACFAQSTNAGDIRGTVTDSSGALIPGVTVSVLNVDTGISKDFVTNQDGLYDTSSIVAGNYRITFSKDGFEKLVRGPITLQVGFTTVNAELRVGATSQEVTVSADVSLLKTETSEQSTTLEARSMEQLPQVAGVRRELGKLHDSAAGRHRYTRLKPRFVQSGPGSGYQWQSAVQQHPRRRGVYYAVAQPECESGNL